MSFSGRVKEEIATSMPSAPCCLHAMAYGMLLFAREFDRDGISIMTEHASVAQTYQTLLQQTAGVSPLVHRSDAGNYTVAVGENDIAAVLSAFSVSENAAITRVNRGNLLNESGEDEGMNCCRNAFFKGAFLSCGTISDPKKSYHLEFVVPYRTLSFDLMKLLSEAGIKAKHMVRRYVNVIYVKDSESIEDLLGLMGAPMSAFEIMNIKIYKNIRNVSNRRANFDEANLTRVAAAACEQIYAIRTIRQAGQFRLLPPDVRAVAEAREANPDASLRELGRLFTPERSVSAINHRLKKLVALGNELQKLSAENAEKAEDI